MQPQLSLKNVSKAFGSKRVLDGLSLDIYKGESLVIIGGSGTGKSVAVKCGQSLIPIDSGEILLDGQNISNLSVKQKSEISARFGMLFQGGALFDSLPVWENIAFALLQKGMKRKQALDVAVDKLQKVGLGADVALLYPSELSGGMQKRVALARAVARNPEIIFFDEPTTGLDPIMANVINRLIVSCVKEWGATAVTITHDMHSVRMIADKVAMIHQGKILWQGRVQDIENSGNPFVDQFIHGAAEGPISVTG